MELSQENLSELCFFAARVAVMAITLKKAQDVQTAPLIAVGLIGGWLTARETGIRPLGGVILGAAGAYAARTWYAKTGLAGATSLVGTYLGAFGLSHPLAKKVGAWPSVLAVTAISAGAAALADAK
ncbi:membrane protein [Corynebacterium lactis RW2-5]|uniref:Membrane protein n=2 Tax=Corynebacterium lactis TaxID=1231000 RepID=A0A0K2H2E4_9CORY|nr:membrane protein [Corynebacterium lactis RW2-5]